jgi:prepilin-type N-terminal cleavage/methylation domain-containing protein
MTRIVSAFSDTPNTRTPSGTPARGFSLIELMVAMAMACIVLGAIYSIHAGLTKSYTTQNAAADVQETMRAGIDFMAEDIWMAGFDPLGTGSFGITAATDTSVHFTSDHNMDGTLTLVGTSRPLSDAEEIEYSLKGTQLIKILDGKTTWHDPDDVLVDNVTGLKFAYYDNDGAKLPKPPGELKDQLTDIRTIEVWMEVQAPAGRGQKVTRTYTTRFRCRNLGL